MQKAITSQFNVTSVYDGDNGDDAVTFEIRTTMDSVRIKDGSSTATFPSGLTASFYKKEGESAAAAYSSYWAIYTRSGSTYTYRKRGGKATSVDLSAQSLSIDKSYDAFVVVISDSQIATSNALPESYLAKKEIIVIQDGYSVRFDISNEYDTVPTDSSGKILRDTTIWMRASLFIGPSKVAIPASAITITKTEGTNPASTDVDSGTTDSHIVSLYYTKDSTMSQHNLYDITCTYDGETYKQTLTVVASMGADFYQILPNLDYLSFARLSDNSLDPPSRTLSLLISWFHVENWVTIDANTAINTNNLIIRYSTDGTMPASKTAGKAWGAASGVTEITWSNTYDMVVKSGVSVSNICIALFDSSGTLLDRETIPIVKDGRNGTDGEDGENGHNGRWYYYGGVWSSSKTYTMNHTSAPFVLRNTTIQGVTKDYFFMLDFGTSGTATGETTLDPASNYNPTSGEGTKPWTLMNTENKYYIAEAIFANFAKLGSFLFNGDWMISQNGKINNQASTDYTKFNSEHPNDNIGTNFIPNYAVDGKTGKAYLNDLAARGTLTITSGNNTVTIDGNGIYGKSGYDGFYLTAGELKRRIPMSGSDQWFPFYAGRYVKMTNDATYEMKDYDDFIVSNTNNTTIKLPQNAVDGKVVTIKNLNTDLHITVKNTHHSIWSNHVEQNGRDLSAYYRAEFVFYNNIWYWSYSEF